MGSCASVNKEKEANMSYKTRLFTKAKGLFVSSPTKEKELFNGEKDPKLVAAFDSLPKRDSNFSDKISDFGSKDETFFDSKGWLESDAEDDFYSVNGDFTPSRGNTPTHPKFMPKITDLSLNEKSPDTISEPSPRKKLSQLFQETPRTEETSKESTENEKTKNEEPIKDSDFAAKSSSEMTPVGERKKREKVLNYVGYHCCVPGLTGTGTAVQAAQ
ncbi:hypothetical protein LUZ60_002087 [Juncus effusus]|nr:hypothetical protein LUZ60_002087 [Juncus effusus]